MTIIRMKEPFATAAQTYMYLKQWHDGVIYKRAMLRENPSISSSHISSVELLKGRWGVGRLKGTTIFWTRASLAYDRYLDKIEVTSFADAGAGRRRYLLGSREIVEQV